MLRLREIREKRGLSLRDLARSSGVGVATLVRLEAEAYDPRLSTLRKLAKALRVSVPTLLGEGKRKKGG
ncbi:MAG: helix-turn-helix transcriptional regulator [Deltaproteobacteria bacterium]|nr:helix-turn-helix transcriptional regulator [Deltaproteobacteria bacterium]